MDFRQRFSFTLSTELPIVICKHILLLDTLEVAKVLIRIFFTCRSGKFMSHAAGALFTRFSACSEGPFQFSYANEVFMTVQYYLLY
ncbi:hypothetical protein D3453_19845 [Salmonella enterica]|uniref:Uncharacterized protein n=1 Tax=Salmonella enterica TaxID=28901 RepID=A0A5U1S2Q7_SALER|nr:hypothetical protein [Salmonella enterica]